MAVDTNVAGHGVSRRLRILLVVDGYYPSTGGAEMQAGLLGRVLTAVGHEVKVLAPRLDRSKPVTEMLDNISVERIGYPRIPAVGAVILMLRFAWRLLRTRGAYDTIHVHMAKNLAAVAGLLRPLLSATVVTKISGAWEFDGGILDPAHRQKPLYRLYNWCVKRADSIQCVSEYTRRRLIEAGYSPRQVLDIPNAVDVARFDSPARPAQFPPAGARVIFVGRLQKVKGLNVLLDAWARRAQTKLARLTIAGDGDVRESLMRQAHDLGIADTVDFLGEVNNVPVLLRAADIYVQPSFQEGLPNSVLEAMAAGLPIIATRVSGNEDLVTDGDNGLLAPPGDAAAIATSLDRLLGDPAAARRMGLRSREIVTGTYGVPAVIAKLEEAYRGGASA